MNLDRYIVWAIVVWLAYATILIWASSCTSSAIRGDTPILMESKRSTPIQRCLATAEFRAQLDRAVRLVGEEMHRAGIISAREATMEGGDTPIACMVDQPEPCILTPASCDMVVDRRCARKAGCGHANGLWVSRHWPPVCRSWWPDEPHCVPSPSGQSDKHFTNTLCKEVCEVFCARHTPPCNCYSDPQLSAFSAAARKMYDEKP